MAQVNIDVAKEASVQAVNTTVGAVNTSVQAVNTKVGTAGDTASSTPTTLFAGIKGLIAWFTGTWTAARAAKIDNIQAVLNTPNGNTLGAWLDYLQATSQSAVNLLNDGTYGLKAINTALSGVGASVQRGAIAYGRNDYNMYSPVSGRYYIYIDVTISSINMAKSTAKVFYNYVTATGTLELPCVLINSTTLRIYYYYQTNYSGGGSIPPTSHPILWEVITF